ncbi:hypothetical protein ID866_12690 [Astraeus odoratus]|nr:hypothetical protein ID866_12690 [Astraeus odoratus]
MMALMSAVHIACLWTMTQQCMAAYQTYMSTWLGSLKDILLHATFHPNGHMSLHIYNYLNLFGPVQSWWCFPFEHLIGHLQCMSTNHVFGVPLFMLLHGNC